MSSKSYEQENFRCITDDLVSVQPVPLDLHVVVALADVIAPTLAPMEHRFFRY